MESETGMISELRTKRIQRSIEYTLLATIFFFFMLAFRGLYDVWIAICVGIIIFCMNFQLTQLRERRRLGNPRSRSRLLADTLESVLLLAFVVGLFGLGGVWRLMQMQEQEYIAYIASILFSLFLAGLSGEVYWQIRNFRALSGEERRNYVKNLSRTIILPYMITRQK